MLQKSIENERLRRQLEQQGLANGGNVEPAQPAAMGRKSVKPTVNGGEPFNTALGASEIVSAKGRRQHVTAIKITDEPVTPSLAYQPTDIAGNRPVAAEDVGNSPQSVKVSLNDGVSDLPPPTFAVNSAETEAIVQRSDYTSSSVSLASQVTSNSLVPLVSSQSNVAARKESATTVVSSVVEANPAYNRSLYLPDDDTPASKPTPPGSTTLLFLLTLFSLQLKIVH